jgi:hypothetical protein
VSHPLNDMALSMDDMAAAFRRMGEQFGHLGSVLQPLVKPVPTTEDHMVAVADYADLMLDILVDPTSWPRPWQIAALFLPLSLPIWLALFVVALLTAVTLTVLLDLIDRVQLNRLLVPADSIKDIS